MSILHFEINHNEAVPALTCDEQHAKKMHELYMQRQKRNLREDMETVVEMIFNFKEKMDSLHPVASDMCRKMMTY